MNFSDLTTLKIGGPIEKVIPIHTDDELVLNLKSLISHTPALQVNHKSYLIIGGGSNLLVSDQGFNGIVIKIWLILPIMPAWRDWKVWPVYRAPSVVQYLAMPGHTARQFPIIWSH